MAPGGLHTKVSAAARPSRERGEATDEMAGRAAVLPERPEEPPERAVDQQVSKNISVVG